MGLEAVLTISIIVSAMFLFATEFFSVDVVAIGVMVIFALIGIVTPSQSVAGFSNSATLTVAAMFVLSNALIKTRVLEATTPFFKRLLKRPYPQTIGAIGALVGSVSGFINNTPVVATFIPVLSDATRRAGRSPSYYLIPLSYLAIFGGTCTLIGTSTNLLVSGIAEDNGLSGFSMFLMAPLGLTFFATGSAYLLLIGHKLIPERSSAEQMRQEASIKNYLTEIRVDDVLDENECRLRETFRRDGQEVEVLMLKRDDKVRENPDPEINLKQGDVLLVRGDLPKIKSLLKSKRLALTDSLKDMEFPDEETKLIEIVLLPNSDIIDKKLEQVDFLEKNQANILAIRQRGEQKFEDLEEVVLKSGDVLLLQTNEQGYKLLQGSSQNKEASFLSIREAEMGSIKTKKLALTLGVILTAIVLAAFELVPILIGAFAGIVVLAATRVISMKEAYQSIDWKVIFLLAGALSMGKAMNNSGVSDMLAVLLRDYIGEAFGPVAVVSALYLMTSVFTEMMSNNASAALLAPIAISLAERMDVTATPFLLAIAFAGSASFMTPVGYQTNTMVYSAGNYKFRDFMRVGTPLNLLFWVLATLLIPVFYPF